MVSSALSTTFTFVAAPQRTDAAPRAFVRAAAARRSSASEATARHRVPPLLLRTHSSWQQNPHAQPWSPGRIHRQPPCRSRPPLARHKSYREHGSSQPPRQHRRQSHLAAMAAAETARRPRHSTLRPRIRETIPLERNAARAAATAAVGPMAPATATAKARARQAPILRWMRPTRPRMPQQTRCCLAAPRARSASSRWRAAWSLAMI